MFYNSHLVMTTDSFLLLAESPMITSVYPDPSQTSYDISIGDSVNFECTIIGFPFPSITWMKDGANLYYDTRYTVSNTVYVTPLEVDGTTYCEATYTLSLNMSQYGDSGTYECRARNEAMLEDSAEFELLFQSKLIS